MVFLQKDWAELKHCFGAGSQKKGKTGYPDFKLQNKLLSFSGKFSPPHTLDCVASPFDASRSQHGVPLNTEFLSFLHSQLSAAAASLSAPAPRVQHSEVYKALCSTDCDPHSPVRWPPAGGSAAFQARSGQELSPQTRLEAQRGRSRDPAAWRPGLHPEAFDHRPAEPHAGCHFIFGPRAQFAPMRSAVLKPIQPESLPDCKATLGGSCNLSASVFWSRRHSERQDPGTRAVLLYGTGARVCGSVTPASFGGKSAAFGFLQWWAKDSPVSRGGR